METLEGLVLFLEALSKESEHLRLQVSWIKTKIQCFIQTVDQACEKVMCSGNLVDVVKVTLPGLQNNIGWLKLERNRSALGCSLGDSWVT